MTRNKNRVYRQAAKKLAKIEAIETRAIEARDHRSEVCADLDSDVSSAVYSGLMQYLSPSTREQYAQHTSNWERTQTGPSYLFRQG